MFESEILFFVRILINFGINSQWVAMSKKRVTPSCKVIHLSSR